MSREGNGLSSYYGQQAKEIRAAQDMVEAEMRRAENRVLIAAVGILCLAGLLLVGVMSGFFAQPVH